MQPVHERIIAHHEAGHAVVTYRTFGIAERASIIPDDETFGNVTGFSGDSFNPGHIEAYILSCYAGGHAQRVIDAATGDDGCSKDDEDAAKWLLSMGWADREQELRKLSSELVHKHWPEIAAVAEELLRVKVLDETEVELIADADPVSLEKYRVIRG